MIDTLARHLQEYIFFPVVNVFILQGGIIVFHNSIHGLLSTFYLRSTKLVAGEAEVEMICSSAFSVEVE